MIVGVRVGLEAKLSYVSGRDRLRVAGVDVWPDPGGGGEALHGLLDHRRKVRQLEQGVHVCL